MGKKTPTQGLAHSRAQHGLTVRTWGPSPENVPTAGSWERERGGGTQKVIINLFMIMAFPMGQGLPPPPPELGQMVFLGASSVSAATATCQESLDLSSSQEAMGGHGFGEAETRLGAGS